MRPAPQKRAKPTLPKVYSYTRFSTPEQAKGDSAKRQLSAAEAWAAKRGLELDRTLSLRDEGVSAYRGTNADEDRGLGAFLFACREKLIEPGSVLLVESLDRLSRMVPRKAQRLVEDICEAGVEIVTLSDAQSYTVERLDTDPTAFLISYLVAVRAHEESRMKGIRVASAWAAKRDRARAGTGGRYTLRAPAWLLPDPKGPGWIVNEDRAQIVRRVYRDTLSGLGEHRITAALNQEGVPPFGRAKVWHRSAVAKLLHNPSVIGALVPGRMEHTGGKKRRVSEEAIADAFPAIIELSNWLSVKAIKDGTTVAARGRGAARGVAHMLAGLARCPKCSGIMTRVSKGSRAKAGEPKLVCIKAKTGTGCTYRSVPVSEVEHALLGGWGALFADTPSGTDGIDRDHRDLEVETDARQERLEALMEALEAAPSAAGAQRVREIEQDLREMRERLAVLDEQRGAVDGGLIRARLEGFGDLMRHHDDTGELDRAAVNASLRALLSGVVVDYGSGLLRLNWKQGGETVMVFAMAREIP